MREVPPHLSRLLSGDGDRAVAWEAFVAEHSRLLLHVARTGTTKYDDAMDAYAYVLERLREDDYRRLREFAQDPRAKLTTWLVVVARRLSIDHYRRRYGRARGSDPSHG
jgi:RNA polymerase sigma factor (sigma-70 family)